ncbi:MAG TPA: hypothetical protein VLI04_10225 [Nocardioidaceae bacterium]|nr:hypothetical protein [Nocardioidaceae bacterium]
MTLPAALVVGLPAPASAAAPYTSWEMRSQPGDYIGGGASYSYTPSETTTISGSGTESGVHFTVVVGAYDEWWYADFDPGEGGTLTPGTTYSGATRYPFNSTEPGLSISGNGRGCNELTGEFTVHEAVFTEGALTKFSVSFEQHCEGGTPALKGVIAWNADNPPPALPQATKLTVTTSKSTYPYGGTAKVIATLTSGSQNRTVSIYATPYGGTKRLLKSANVGLNNQLTVSVPVTQRTTFTASYAGDANFDPSSASRVVTAGAKIASAMKRYVAKSGKYFVYPVTKPAFLVATVSPNHAGDCLRFLAQVYFRGTWRQVGQLKCGRLSARSSFLAGFKVERSGIGYPFRMHAIWGGDTQNAPTTGKWHYFKFKG